MKKSGIKLRDDERDLLRALDLSSDEINLYSYMLETGQPTTAQTAAEELRTFPSATYRLFYALEDLSLIRRVNARPKSYIAIMPRTSFKVAVNVKRQTIQDILSKLSFDDGSDLPAEIVIGKQAVYDRYVREASKSQKNIQIYAIGIAYDEVLHRSQKLAIERGVSIYHVVQRYKPSNYHVIKKWNDLGVKLRINESGKGYHLMIFDERRAIVSFSSPNNPNDRISIVTDNAGALRMFKDQYKDIWECASEINIEKLPINK